MKKPMCKRDHQLDKSGGYNYCSSCGQQLRSLCPSDATACSGSRPDLSPLQRSHNYLTYQMGVIAHKLDHRDSPEAVSAFALEARDYAEAIVSDPGICIPNAERTHGGDGSPNSKKDVDRRCQNPLVSLFKLL